MKLNLKQNKKGFTLVELLTVIAIIGILASSLIVMLSVHKKRALASKVLTEFAGVMNSIYLCKSDDGSINNSSNGGSICSLGSGYGTWPDLSGSGSEGFSYGGVKGDLNTKEWAYLASNGSGSGKTTICCNSLSGRCQKLENGTSCEVNTILK